MIVPQVSFASVAPASPAPVSASQKYVAPVGAAARVNLDSYPDADRDAAYKPEAAANEEKNNQPKADEVTQPRVERQLADLGGTRLAILHDEDAERFVYQTVDTESQEVKSQYPTDEELKRIARFHEQASQAKDEIL